MLINGRVNRQAGGAVGRVEAGNSSRSARSREQQLREDVLFERLEICLLAEEIGFVHGETAGEDLDLAARQRSGQQPARARLHVGRAEFARRGGARGVSQFLQTESGRLTLAETVAVEVADQERDYRSVFLVSVTRCRPEPEA